MVVVEKSLDQQTYIAESMFSSSMQLHTAWQEGVHPTFEVLSHNLQASNVFVFVFVFGLIPALYWGLRNWGMRIECWSHFASFCHPVFVTLVRMGGGWAEQHDKPRYNHPRHSLPPCKANSTQPDLLATSVTRNCVIYLKNTRLLNRITTNAIKASKLNIT